MDYNNLCPGCFNNKGTQNPCPACGYEEKPLEASIYLPPRTILSEKYIIGKVLGQGGFGITYLGWDLNLNMKLAIKEFFPQGMVSRLPGQSKVVSFTGAEDKSFDFWLERFLGEARTLARFEQHPNIVSVRDFFKANNTAYMIMSYVEGMTLSQYLTRSGGKLSYKKAIEVMMPVMDALREVHEVGVMHRDVSPDNIFIDNKGRIVLIDFGAARQEISDKSKSLSIILKAGYAPEEQYRSRGKQGPWTDVYAVAATIYRLITDQVPPEAMDRLDEDLLTPPSQLGVVINIATEEILLKALAVKAEKRYQSIEAFQNDLLELKEPKDKESQGKAEALIPVKKRDSQSGEQEHTDHTAHEELRSNKKKHLTFTKLVILATIGLLVGLSILIINQILGKQFNNSIGDDLNEYGPHLSETDASEEIRGNSVGNIVNVGIAAQQGEWIYHRTNDPRGGIYKTNIQGTEQYKLNDDDSWNINVLGNWLYYSNSAENWNVYKVDIDGDNRTRINYDDSGNLNVVGEWIYYRNDDENGSIYKIRVDGSDRTRLNNEQSYYLNVVDDWVYFQNRSDEGSLYKIRVDGTGRTKLNNDDSWHLNVVEGWVYYCAANESSNIYKVRLDGSDRILVNFDQSANLNINNGWLYYRNDDDGSKLYKIRPDGSERRRLNNDQTFFFSITDDWIYYQNKSDGDKIYRMRLDGSARQPVD